MILHAISMNGLIACATARTDVLSVAVDLIQERLGGALHDFGALSDSEMQLYQRRGRSMMEPCQLYCFSRLPLSMAHKL
jgi:hypothetical protein